MIRRRQARVFMILLYAHHHVALTMRTTSYSDLPSSTMSNSDKQLHTERTFPFPTDLRCAASRSMASHPLLLGSTAVTSHPKFLARKKESRPYPAPKSKTFPSSSTFFSKISSRPGKGTAPKGFAPSTYMGSHSSAAVFAASVISSRDLYRAVRVRGAAAWAQSD